MPDHDPATGPAWYETGVETVAPGVHRIPLPLPGDGLRAVNVYAVEDGDRLTLIDAGWAIDEAFDRLEGALASLGFGFDQVVRMLITHMHRDHYTLAVRIRRLFGARVLVGIGERESLERLSQGRADGQRSWLRHWGAEALREQLDALPHRDEDYALPDEWIAGPADIRVGDRTLRAIPTPGHTRGHLVFADLKAGVLFAGDHVLPTITPSIGLDTVRSELPLGDFLTSLRTVCRLPDLRLLPAHGPAGMGSHVRTRELRGHHERRLDATFAVVGPGTVTAYSAAAALRWTRRNHRFEDLDTFGRLLAVGETAAHLDLLVQRGRLESSDATGTRLYQAKT